MMGNYSNRKIKKVPKEVLDKEGSSVVVVYNKEEKKTKKRKKVSGNELPVSG